MSNKKRVLGIKVLPGEPTNGTGKVCIHLFVPDPKGPFEEPSVMYKDENNKLNAKATRGRLACDPKRLVAPREAKGVIHITQRTDDPRATTCPECIKSQDYQRLMQVLNNIVS